MAPANNVVNVSQELAKLKHEKKNGQMRKLPGNATVQRRPLNHPPVASPFAGSGVTKVVYISRRTPVISAVKRVKKFLRHIENREVQSIDMVNTNDRKALNQLAEASKNLAKSAEKVFVKASGRAMEQALRVAEWFRNSEKEMLCNVEVQTSNVAAIDDISIIEDLSDEVDNGEIPTHDKSLHPDVKNTEALVAPELSRDPAENVEAHDQNKDAEQETIQTGTKTRRKRKRKRTEYDKEDLPEARLRWVKTVEITISLRA